jgi:arginyl-tRNA synthetase
MKIAMGNVKEQIENAIGFEVMPSGVETLADYQCNAAFKIAKDTNRKAGEVANELCAKFAPLLGEIATVSAHQSGFVNLILTPKSVQKQAKNIIQTGVLPLKSVQKRVIFFDYGGANIAKQLHIGHLRSPIIGEALKRVFKAFGHTTVSDTFFGDWGLQMGLVLAQMEDEGIDAGAVTLEMLNEIYPKASKRSKLEPEFYKRAEEITAELQQKHAPWFAKWRQIRGVSVGAIMESYTTLGCTFDTTKGESDACADIPKVIEILKKNGAHESEGCLILEVKKDGDTKPLPPVILQKSNGGALYSTTDIATLYARFKAFKPHVFVYLADARQELHIEQVFRAARSGGIVSGDTILKHVAYGTINGSDGKPFKTRSGDTVNLNDIIKMVTAEAQKRMKHGDEKGAQIVGLAALKFADLINNVRKDYVFDSEKFMAFEGKTGPYLLYTVARINSILKKTGDMKFETPPREIVLAAVKLADAYVGAAENFTVNGIVEAAWNLANKFNNLYGAETILGNAQNTNAARLTRTALLFALNTLAIDTVDEM